MERLRIKQYSAIPSPGDLKAVVSGDTLLLPECVAIELIKLGGRTVEDLLSQMKDSPSWLCRILGWTTADVEKASLLLRHQLKGRIDPGYLREEKLIHPAVSLGLRLK